MSLIAVLADGRRAQLAGLGLLVLAGSLLPLAGPQLLRLFIDNASLDRPASLLVLLAGGFLGSLLTLLGVRSAWARSTCCSAYTSLLRDPLEQIAEQQHVAQDAIAGYARVRQLLDEQPSIRDEGRSVLPDGPLELELDGAGLLLRLLDPSEGTVRIGRTDVRDVPLADLRRRVALVTQDVQLFDATVRDNLTLFGAHRAGDDRLVQVLDDLGLGAWRRALPNGSGWVRWSSSRSSRPRKPGGSRSCGAERWATRAGSTCAASCG